MTKPKSQLTPEQTEKTREYDRNYKRELRKKNPGMDKRKRDRKQYMRDYRERKAKEAEQ